MKKILTAFSIAVIILACAGGKNEKNTRSAVEVMLIASPAADSCAEPYLFTDKNGLVYLSWTEKKGKESSLKFSVFSGNKWSEPVTIASGNNWFVNWADYPVMASDGNKNLIAHYLEKSDTAKFTYDIKIISSTDSGKTWSPSKKLHDDNVKAEHGFVSTASFQGGFIAAWLDGRKSGVEAGTGGHDGHHGEMTLRGAILDYTGNKTSEWELDSRICDCCQTGVAITGKGPAVVYRDRSDDEVRDISVVRYVKGQWTSPETIYPDNWKIKACPVNGPRISAIGNDLAIAWFSMKNKIGEVKLIFSKNGGESFSKPVRIDEGNSIGRVGVIMLDSARAMVCWMEGADIKVVKVHADGSKEVPITIAASSEKRSGGFPQMTKSGNKVFFAWTDDKAKTIRTASISL
ncbi:MAG TPA: sialidase family protein [Chitinophagaceae bacterium]|nr:sialidase family protein [Chitinophagaceae bacterium]